MSGVGLGGRESDLTIPKCGLAIMKQERQYASVYRYEVLEAMHGCVYDESSAARPRPGRGGGRGARPRGGNHFSIQFGQSQKLIK